MRNEHLATIGCCLKLLPYINWHGFVCRFVARIVGLNRKATGAGKSVRDFAARAALLKDRVVEVRNGWMVSLSFIGGVVSPLWR